MVYGEGPVVNDPLGTGPLCNVFAALPLGDAVRGACPSDSALEKQNRRASRLRRFVSGGPRRPARLDAFADHTEDAADLRAKEDEGNDRDNRDQGEDQRVFSETLALLVAPEGSEERVESEQGGLLTPRFRAGR